MPSGGARRDPTHAHRYRRDLGSGGEQPFLAALARTEPHETELLVMVAHHAVALGPTIDADQPLDAARPRVLDDLAQHHRLDPATEHAAAHQPGVDLPGDGVAWAA